MIFHNKLAQEIYDKQRNVLDQKNGDIARRLIRNTTEEIHKLARKDLAFVEYYKGLYNEIINSDSYHFVMSYLPEGLYIIDKNHVPIVILPESIKALKFDSDIIELVNKYFTSSYSLVDFFSIRSQSTIPLRTVFRNGKPSIIGNVSNDLLGISRLAHEYGHCLMEIESISSGAERLIKSETFAQLLEEKIPINLINDINPSILIDWYKYNRRIDALNYYCFFLEYSALFGYTQNQYFIDFKDKLYLRESIYTLIGYQAIYAKASFLRFKNLKKYYLYDY